MSDIKTAYEEVALAVLQLCTDEPPAGLAKLKRIRRLKVKGKKTPRGV